MNNNELDATYECLREVRQAGLAIQRKEIQIRELQSCLTRSAALQPQSDRVKSSPTNRLEEIEAKVDTLERELDGMRQDRAMLIMEVSADIESIPDENQKTVLSDFYIGRLSMASIADILSYSESYMYKLRKQGVIALHNLRISKRG